MKAVTYVSCSFLLYLSVKSNEIMESPARVGEGEEGDSGIDANSQGSCSSNEVKTGASRRSKVKKNKKPTPAQQQQSTPATASSPSSASNKPDTNVSYEYISLFYFKFAFFIMTTLMR